MKKSFKISKMSKLKINLFCETFLKIEKRLLKILWKVKSGFLSRERLKRNWNLKIKSIHEKKKLNTKIRFRSKEMDWKERKKEKRMKKRFQEIDPMNIWCYAS